MRVGLESVFQKLQAEDGHVADTNAAVPYVKPAAMTLEEFNAKVGFVGLSR